jgi:hypothetical protein
MSTRLSETIALLHATQRVILKGENINVEGAAAFADALKANTAVTFLLQCVARFIN